MAFGGAEDSVVPCINETKHFSFQKGHPEDLLC